MGQGKRCSLECMRILTHKYIATLHTDHLVHPVLDQQSRSVEGQTPPGFKPDDTHLEAEAVEERISGWFLDVCRLTKPGFLLEFWLRRWSGPLMHV